MRLNFFRSCRASRKYGYVTSRAASVPRDAALGGEAVATLGYCTAGGMEMNDAAHRPSEVVRRKQKKMLIGQGTAQT